MEQWIPFEAGSYRVDRACAATPVHSAVSLEQVVIKISEGPNGIRSLSGSCLVRPYLLVELSEDSETIDIILDFGEGFVYRLPRPRISAGKVLSPGVKATMQFFPVTPWARLPASDYGELMNRMRFLTID